ncbi:IS3 family transposase [Candidatus Nomurabacteria bacterium]|nr:IS3 family transposase [Candidatus Nomurabacteria bacterium]
MLTIKHELGPISTFKGLAELHEAIALQIHYYNTKRIHTALKTSPAAYATSLKTEQSKRDKVLQNSVP